VYMCICANNVQILGFGGVGGFRSGGGIPLGGGGPGDRAHIYIIIYYMYIYIYIIVIIIYICTQSMISLSSIHEQTTLIGRQVIPAGLLPR